MSAKSRLLLPLGAAVLLGAALAVPLLRTSSEAPPEAPAAAPAPVDASPPEPVRPAREPRSAEPVRAEPLVEGRAEAGPGGTVVPVGPGDEVPEPEVEGGPAQENEPIEPEAPRTAAWRHEKLVRVTELLGREVERLEEERQVAKERGQAEEVRRLSVLLERHRGRLGRLGEEAAALEEEARAESGR
ncbi:MAG TPA: hypothetical protein VLQ93_17185 [Myxococcaceae bacterium]|nr:hypothetical protein [Myxococcaceae bacterium]